MRTERKKASRLQARYQQLLKEQGKKPESGSDTTTAVQEAIDLVKDDLNSAPGSSSTWPRWSHSRHSPTPQPATSFNHESLEYNSDSYVSSEEASRRFTRVRACSSDAETEPSTPPTCLPAFKQVSPSQVNDLKSAPLQSVGLNAVERRAENLDEEGRWILPSLDTDSKRSDTVVRESGARVKDEDGRITWQEVGSPSSSSTSTR